MSLKDQIVQDIETVFLNKDEFAEEIVYSSQGGEGITISALVVREQKEPSVENAGRSLKNQVDVYMACSDVPEIDKVSDRIVLDDTEGVSRTARICEILGKHQGLWHVKAGW